MKWKGYLILRREGKDNKIFTNASRNGNVSKDRKPEEEKPEFEEIIF